MLVLSIRPSDGVTGQKQSKAKRTQEKKAHGVIMAQPSFKIAGTETLGAILLVPFLRPKEDESHRRQKSKGIPGHVLFPLLYLLL